MITSAETFRLAPMSPLIRMLTVALLALPIVFLATAVFGRAPLTAPALLVVAIYGWIWVRFRPTRFVVRPEALEVRWPLKRRELRREDIADVRVIDKQELRRRAGWCLRVGAGGLWGGFG